MEVGIFTMLGPEPAAFDHYGLGAAFDSPIAINFKPQAGVLFQMRLSGTGLTSGDRFRIVHEQDNCGDASTA